MSPAVIAVFKIHPRSFHGYLVSCNSLTQLFSLLTLRSSLFSAEQDSFNTTMPMPLANRTTLFNDLFFALILDFRLWFRSISSQEFVATPKTRAPSSRMLAVADRWQDRLGIGGKRLGGSIIMGPLSTVKSPIAVINELVQVRACIFVCLL